MRATKTCAGRPGSQGHEYQDALQYARWGVDYLKYDWCNTETRNARRGVLDDEQCADCYRAGRLCSACANGARRSRGCGAKALAICGAPPATSATSGSAKITWPGGGCCQYGMVEILDLQVGLDAFAGPGHWNDPDMLEVGNGGMTHGRVSRAF